MVRKNYEALGLTVTDIPTLLHEGQVIFRGLPRTEAWLRGAFNLGSQTGS